MSQKDGLQEVQENENKPIRTRSVPIRWEHIGLFFDSESDYFVGKLVESTPGVSKIYLDDEKSFLIIEGYPDSAIERIQQDIGSKMKNYKFPHRFIDSTPIKFRIEDNSHMKTFLTFKRQWPSLFNVRRFRSLFGVKNVTVKRINENLIWIKDVQANTVIQMQKFEELWNKNCLFVDIEINWTIARNSLIPQSNFNANLLVTPDFLQSSSIDRALNKMRTYSGIDYIDITCCNEEDIILNITAGSTTQRLLDLLMAELKSLFDAFIDTLTIHRLGSYENMNKDYVFCIPYVTYKSLSRHFSFHCKSKKKSQGKSDDEFKLIATPHLGYLRTLYEFDPEVIYVELNEIKQTITLACTSQERLNRLQFEVRGKLSFFNSYGWRRRYHGNFRTHIKVSLTQREMNASFLEMSLQTNPFLSADFTDFVPKSNSLTYIKLVEPPKPANLEACFLRTNPFSKVRYTLFCESSMLARFREFFEIDDFSHLDNMKAHVRFGVTLFEGQRTKGELSPVSTLIEKWEKHFNGVFSFDLNSSYRDALNTSLLAQGFLVVEKQNFTRCYFNDIVNNLRFMTTIFGEKVSLGEKLEYSYCATDHIHYRVVDIDSSKCSYEIIVSSQKPCENTRAKEFVEESIKSGELLEENVMSLNSYYSMYNVSIVDRTVFKYNNFIIHLDVVSKKSNQRYGKFCDVVNLTLHCPRLNKSIKDLQGNKNDESLKNSIVDMYKELISAGENMSVIIDQLVESIV